MGIMRFITMLAWLHAFSCLASASEAWNAHAGKPGPNGWRCYVIQPDPEDHGPDGITIHDWDGGGNLDLFVNDEEDKYSRLFSARVRAKWARLGRTTWNFNTEDAKTRVLAISTTDEPQIEPDPNHSVHPILEEIIDFACRDAFRGDCLEMKIKI